MDFCTLHPLIWIFLNPPILKDDGNDDGFHYMTMESYVMPWIQMWAQDLYFNIYARLDTRFGIGEVITITNNLLLHKLQWWKCESDRFYDEQKSYLHYLSGFKWQVNFWGMTPD